MGDVAKVRTLSESSTDEESKKDENSDVSEISDSESDSDSCSSSSDSGSDSEDDLEDISTADSPVTNNSQTSTPPHQHLLIQQQLHHQQEDSHIGMETARRGHGVRDPSLVSPDPDMFIKSKAALIGDGLDPMDLDLVGGGQRDHLVGLAGGAPRQHFTNANQFDNLNLLEDISTDENSDIPMMTQESETESSQLCTMNSQFETELSNAAEGVCADSLLDTGGPGNFSQEDLLQLISTGASGPDQGFLDPVFVDHEESQNAADLDQIVFEEGEEADDDDDFLNDHRLATICSGTNSLGTSERGSVNLNEFEDGELPSSPEDSVSKSSSPEDSVSKSSSYEENKAEAPPKQATSKGSEHSSRSKSSRRSEDNSTNKQSTSKLPTSKSDSKSKHTTESSTSRKHDRPDKKQNDKCKTNDNRSRSDADKVKTVGDKHRSSRDRSSHTKTSKDAKLADESNRKRSSNHHDKSERQSVSLKRKSVSEHDVSLRPDTKRKKESSDKSKSDNSTYSNSISTRVPDKSSATDKRSSSSSSSQSSSRHHHKSSKHQSRDSARQDKDCSRSQQQDRSSTRSSDRSASSTYKSKESSSSGQPSVSSPQKAPNSSSCKQEPVSAKRPISSLKSSTSKPVNNPPVSKSDARSFSSTTASSARDASSTLPATTIMPAKSSSSGATTVMPPKSSSSSATSTMPAKSSSSSASSAKLTSPNLNATPTSKPLTSNSKPASNSAPTSKPQPNFTTNTTKPPITSKPASSSTTVTNRSSCGNTLIASKPTSRSTTVPSTLTKQSSSPTSDQSSGASSKPTLPASKSSISTNLPSHKGEICKNTVDQQVDDDVCGVQVLMNSPRRPPGKDSPAGSDAQESDDSSTSGGGCKLGQASKPHRKKLSLKDYKKRLAEKKDTCSEEETERVAGGPGHNSTSISHDNHKNASQPIPPTKTAKSAAAQLTTAKSAQEPATAAKSVPDHSLDPAAVNTSEPDDLHGFDILDEVGDDRDEEENAVPHDQIVEKMLDEDFSDMDEDEEVFKMVEKGVKKDEPAVKEIVPEKTQKKYVLSRDYMPKDMLPCGWTKIIHRSGMPFYFHKESRVATFSLPYQIGLDDRVRSHQVPITSVPCANFKYLKEKEDRMTEQLINNQQPSSSSCNTEAAIDKPSLSSSDTTNQTNASSAIPDGSKAAPNKDGYLTCPFSGRDNVSPDSTTADSSGAEPAIAHTPQSNIEQPMEVDNAVAATSNIEGEVLAASTGQSSASEVSAASAGPSAASNVASGTQGSVLGAIVDDVVKKTLSVQEMQDYCTKLFKFDEIEIKAFKTWGDKRLYHKQEKKKVSTKDPVKEGAIVITIPTFEFAGGEKAEEGDIFQKVTKKSKKQWVIHPSGKSWVCLLYEMLAQSMRCQPSYEFRELDNAANPYSATVYANKIEYGTGIAPSKKLAKARAARRTLEIMIPEIKEKLKDMPDDGTIDATNEDSHELKMFNEIRVEDPRITDLSQKVGEPGPYQVLLACLEKNYGLLETNVKHEMKQLRNQQHQYTISVNNRQVDVMCKNKKDGKQLAAQKMLQLVHPNINNWGSMLRLYGNRRKLLNMKKQKEHEVIALQLKHNNPTNMGHHSKAILGKLKKEMRNIAEQRRNVIPIGKFHAPQGVVNNAVTGIKTDHIDI